MKNALRISSLSIFATLACLAAVPACSSESPAPPDPVPAPESAGAHEDCINCTQCNSSQIYYLQNQCNSYNSTKPTCARPCTGVNTFTCSLVYGAYPGHETQCGNGDPCNLYECNGAGSCSYPWNCNPFNCTQCYGSGDVCTESQCMLSGHCSCG